MSRPPMISLLQDAPMTLGIAAAAALASAHWWTGNEVTGLILASSSDAWQPWRYLTTTLPHDSVIQLTFNIVLFTYFGLMLERGFGTARFLAIFALIAAGSSAAEFAVSWGPLGLSGGLYGFFALLWVLSRRDERYLGAVGPLIKTLMISLLGFYVLTTIAGTFHASNVAHAAGMILGAMLGLCITSKRQAQPRLAALFTGCFALAIAGATLGRPYINLTPATAWELAEAAVTAAIEGDYETTIELHRQLIEADPFRGDLWFNLGKALCESGEYAEAIEALERAVELDPREDAFRSQLAWCRAWQRGEDAQRAFFLEDFRRSQVLYREAISHDPTIADLWHGLGHALASVQEYEEAARAFRRALDLDPQHEQYQKAAAWAEARRMAHLAHERFLEEDYDRSVILYRHALRLDETVPQWWYNLGLALARLERFIEARRALTKTLELDPEFDGARALLKWLDQPAPDE